MIHNDRSAMQVTSKKDQKQYWMRRDEPYRFVSAKDFVRAYGSFHIGKKLQNELATLYDKSKSHPAALTTNKYGSSKKQLFKACMDREILLLKRNSFFYIFKLFQLAIMALITMTLFFRTKMHRNGIEDGGLYVSALFFTIVRVMFNGMAEISMIVKKLPVFYKQRDFYFFPTWAYVLPSWFIKIPFSFIETAVWTIPLYYVIGFDPNIWRFVKHFLLLVVANQTASALFRFIGAVCRNMTVANTVGTFALIELFALGGFILSRDDVKKWWLWGYWSSPMMYAMNGIVVNEFLGHKFTKPFDNTTLGRIIVTSRGLFAETYWYWIAVAAMLGYVVLYNLFYFLSLEFLDPYMGSHSNVIEEDEERDTESVELSSINDGNQNQKRGMVLPFESHSITFDNIKYSVDMPKEMIEQGVSEHRLVLLNNLSGAFRPGVLTALMGVSGAGKTTLMDVLAGRKTGGIIEGDVRISGYPKKQETFARISGYCEQTDIHSPHVTVYESLVYSAWLRLPTDVNESSRKMFVDEVMNLVELNPLRNSLVGLPGVDGLSTEQRKRLTIAVELVANPSIIFMDEPTSGLDARAAAIVMRTVRNTVDTGRTVVCTIHQPSIDIFEAFDELFLMKRGGKEIYVGPVGNQSSDLINYFEDIEGVSKIKDGYNPATWMLEVTSSSRELAIGVDFAEIYKNSQLYMRNKALIAELCQPRSETNDLYFATRYSTSFFTQCWVCLWKQRLSYWRNPLYVAVRFVFTTSVALLLGSIFWQLGGKRKTIQHLTNAIGALYTSVIFLGVGNASSVQPIVDIERTVFYRERAAGMYSGLPYAFAQVMVEIPYVFMQAFLYGLIVYAMIGFDWTVAKFFWFSFFMFCFLLYITFYGMMVVAITPSMDMAAIISGAFFALWSLFSGFIIPRSEIPIWWRWYYWADPWAWTLYGLTVSQFGDFDDVLTSGETVKDYLSRYYGYQHDFIGVLAGVHVGLVVTFAVIFAYSIRSFNFQNR